MYKILLGSPLKFRAELSWIRVETVVYPNKIVVSQPRVFHFNVECSYSGRKYRAKVIPTCSQLHA